MLSKMRYFGFVAAFALSGMSLICDASAKPESVVRIQAQNSNADVSGFALSPDIVVGSAGALRDQATVTVHRGNGTAEATATIVGGVAIIHVRGAGGTAQLAAGEATGETSVEIYVAQGAFAHPASGLLSASAGGARVIGAPDGGGVAFNRCGEVVALIAPGGAVVTASSIASALRTASIAHLRAEAPCAASANSGVEQLQRQVAELERQLRSTLRGRQRRQIELDITRLQAQIAELAAQKTRNESRNAELEAEARATREKANQQRQLALRIAFGVGALVLVLGGLAAWLFARSRKLKKSLAEASKKDNRSWNDCVLESASGATVKLPGAKLAKGGVVVGRSREDADVVVDKDDVSRRHARFEALDGALHVSDLGSTNKTFVNGKDIERGLVKRLQEGDKVSIGSNEFTVRILRERG